MFYKRFNFLVVLRLLLIMINFIVIAIIFGDKRLFFNQIILSVILIIQIGDLLRFINQTNRELSRLFLAIRHSDFSVTFKQSKLGSSFRELQESMGDIIETYKRVKIEKEGQFHFLQMLVSQINVGIIALKNDDITLINPTAETMLNVSGIRNWLILKQQRAAFTNQIETLDDNSRQLIEVQTADDKKFMSVHKSHLMILDKRHVLITFQDINSEIEQKEIEAWHKLIRILTHEIMNSVTPISSLTETLEGILKTKAGEQKTLADLNDENLNDIRFSLQTIRKRSDGLLNFVENYRKLTKVPKPQTEKINVADFISEISALMLPKLKEKNIGLLADIAPAVVVEADPVLLEQVLINLITNSIHAVEDRPVKNISISSYEQPDTIHIVIKDSGKGIPKKELSEIFIPFFSTKKDGSGIGLSLSKQIMSLHRGSIQVKSDEGVGTEMILKFRRNR
jgi:two-component system, NtrC family, nitrogen regulation sensor histidine kinase NtrY